MTVMDIQFTKFFVEKRNIAADKINVQNRISLTSIQSRVIPIGQPTDTAVIGFSFELIYEPSIGNILIEGNLLILLDKAKIDQAIESFNKTKTVQHELMQTVMKAVFNKCQIQGIILARDVNLPSPVPLPQIKVDTPQVKADSVKDVKKK